MRSLNVSYLFQSYKQPFNQSGLPYNSYQHVKEIATEMAKVSEANPVNNTSNYIKSEDQDKIASKSESTVQVYQNLLHFQQALNFYLIAMFKEISDNILKIAPEKTQDVMNNLGASLKTVNDHIQKVTGKYLYQ